ncbi:MAG: flagellar export protein FliJ [Candidatus Latescibacteria bacterium]|nr:flagellar export protein FliJ [Candidatus Latescibacterota bacterium]
MNRFRFRLASILRLREVHEDKKKREFGAALGKLNLENNELNQLKGSLQDHEIGMEKRSRGTVSVHQLRNNFNYARALDMKIGEQKKHVKAAADVVESRRVELAESSKKKKILEHLKDRDREEHNHAVEKEEQVVIDELTTQRYKNHRD